ncbi:MAG: 4-hydroxy-tetrahydrodipicolinate synthase [Thermomicrobiales bacterium]|nr:4-hydroxy-tetrahydrodipicolinate synthase [Thermomicrobiales bacterium]
MIHITPPSTPFLSGAYTAMITPLRGDEVDIPALRQMTDFQIEQGISGLVPCGTTGESVTLTDREYDLVIATVIEAAGERVPVIAGTGTNDTRRTIEQTRRAEEAGATAALVVVPYYNKPTQEGMFRHFTAVADATDLPIVLYNVPGRTGVNMSAETTLRLAEHPNIVAVKEASGNLEQISEIVIGAPEGFAVLSGDDALTLPVLSVGGHGVISVTSNIAPRAVSELVELGLSGDFAAARTRHQHLFGLNRAMFFDNNPTAVKTAASMLGLCSAELRLPQVEMSAGNHARLGEAMTAFGLMSVQALAAD